MIHCAEPSSRNCALARLCECADGSLPFDANAHPRDYAAVRTLGLLSRKGGSGKVTLAVLAQRAGRRILLIDLDPQHSAADWWRAREADWPQLVETTPAALRDVLDAARAEGGRTGGDRHAAVSRAGRGAGRGGLRHDPRADQAGNPRSARDPRHDRRDQGGGTAFADGAQRLPTATRGKGGIVDRRRAACRGGVRRAGRLGGDRQPLDVLDLADGGSDGGRGRTGRRGRA